MKVDIAKCIQEEIRIAVQSEVATQLSVVVGDYLCVAQKPEFEKWGRYLTIQQAMTYAGYTSRGGLSSFLKKYNIKPIKNSSKDVKIDRYQLDKAMMKDRVREYKETLKI